MLDIEKKSYQLVEENLDSLDKVLFDPNYIYNYVFQNNEQVEWSRVQSLEKFIQIAIRLLESGKLFEVVSIVKMLPKNPPNSDIALFYALLERLVAFLKRILDLVVLDQYYYLLSQASEEDFTFDKLSKPFKTGSYYEQNYFGLPYFQVGFDSEQAMDLFDKEEYFVKEEYQKQIKELLKDSKYRYKRSQLNDALHQMVIKNMDSPYLDFFYLSVNTLIEVPKYVQEKITMPVEDPSQISLFKR